MKKSTYEKWFSGIPPAIIVGAIIVLLPIFSLMTFQNINRQKESSTRLLIEKGAALIRSFEAGTRTGMMGDRRGQFKLQRLITETAQQPDIEYILVTDMEGVIHASDDPRQIGSSHGVGPDTFTPASLDVVQWRLASTVGGRVIFEVFQRFSPMKGPKPEMGPGTMHGRMMRMWSQLPPGRQRLPDPKELLIFIGLDMSSIEAARVADSRHTIIMGVTLLFIGITGIMLIFLLQSYRSTQSSLTRIRAFSEKLVENMPISLIAIDGEEKIASINPVAGTTLVLSPGSVVGKPAEGILPTELYRLVSGFSSLGSTFETEVECVVNPGQILPLQVSISRLSVDNGSSAGALLLFKDLSEVRSLQKQVARSRRLASVGKLAAGVAHEIRNPLSSIKGFATYFKEKYPDINEDRQIANIMIQEVDRLNRVVSQLLEFAKPIPVRVKAVEAHAFIENSLQLIQKQTEEKQIEVQLTLSDNVDTIPTDSDQLNQVLLNLYLNAIDAMDVGGKLSIEVDADRRRKGVRIRIADNGSGILPEDLPLVFDPYFTTKSGGTGLGLAVAHNIIEAHKGEIMAESRGGTGTVITIFLPDAEEPSHDKREPNHSGG